MLVVSEIFCCATQKRWQILAFNLSSIASGDILGDDLARLRVLNAAICRC